MDIDAVALLLKFYDQWYGGEVVMQLQYGLIGTCFTEQEVLRLKDDGPVGYLLLNAG